MTIATRVQNIINVEDSELGVINELIDIQTESLLLLINEKTLPKNMEFIVVETTIARYNRIGSEGLDSERIDIVNQTFTKNIFEPYQKLISEYRKNKYRIRVV